MTKDIQKTALRLPREIHTAVKDAAEQNNRTMNAEIVDRLAKSFINEGHHINIDNNQPLAKENGEINYDKLSSIILEIQNAMNDVVKVIDNAKDK
ncbi:Arc family DNA-binding protein [Vibrio injensis]|uniref:Arc family DNA-binding protein n=1 Tax=Vibrio injensis TaxID=1307414 RepID=UPI00278C4A02|nr:Arc family DNA-binding protein [Vibrio injensis]